MRLKIISLYIIFLSFAAINTIVGQNISDYSHPLSKSILLSLGAGTNYSFSDYDTTDIGINFGGNLEYYFPSKSKSAFGLRFNVSQNNFSGTGNNLGLPTDFETVERKVGLGLVYSYAVSNEILPFLSLTGFYALLSFDGEIKESRFFDIKNGEEDNSLILQVGGGLKYKINEDFDLNFELGYNYVQKDNIDAIKYGDYQDFYLSGQIGFSYTLWNEKDSDGDGILDEDDKCPFEREDIDGYQDDDGCPDNDNDNDGILDINDACQNIAEDIDGFQDDDGCPDVDNDGDGIKDLDDDCPNIAEDIDGFEDGDGCPDADNDGDGILDAVDACVDSAEVFNGYKDDDGCPDELPKPVYVQPKQVIERPKTPRTNNTPKPVRSNVPSSFTIRSEITFGTESSQIKSSAYGELNRIVNELKKYPNTTWRIEGHTDSKKSRADANRITKSQADAILSYFISQGLQPGKFQSVGFGDATPVASNTSVYGRMKNRRIIIRKIN